MSIAADQDVEIVEGGEPIDWDLVLAEHYGVQAPSEWDKAAFFVRRAQDQLDAALNEPPKFGVVVDKLQCPILGVEFKNDLCLLLDDSMEPVSVDYVLLCLEQAADAIMDNEGDDAAGLDAMKKIKNPYTSLPIQRMLLVKAALA
jgi:hypothetical protein